MFARHRSPVLALLFATSACAVTPAQVVVELSADVGLMEDGHSIAFVVSGEGLREERVVVLGDGDPPAAWPLRIIINPLNGDTGRRWSVDTELRDAAGDAIAEARVRGGFAEDDLRYFLVRFQEACRGVRCPPARTCDVGACIDACVEGSPQPAPVRFVECPGDSSCTIEADDDSLVLFSFDESLLSDSGSAPEFYRCGAEECSLAVDDPLWVDGAECGEALSFDGSTVLSITEAIDEIVRTIELRVRIDDLPGQPVGLVSRRGEMDTLQILLTPEGSVFAVVENSDEAAVRCASTPLTLDEWAHIRLTMAPGRTELYIDGVEGEGTGVRTTPSDSEYDCGTSAGLAAQNSAAPILLGATQDSGSDAFIGLFVGAIDELHAHADILGP